MPAPAPRPTDPADARPRLTDPARLAAVEATGLLPPGAGFGGPEAARGPGPRPEPRPELERVARLAARALAAPVAQVNLLTAAAQVPVAAAADRDLAAWCVPVGLERSYCRHVVEADAPLAVHDARRHPLVRDGAATREAGIVGYLGVPVRAGDGTPLGTVCVVDRRARRWTAADRAALEDLAAVAADAIALGRAEQRARTLADAVPHVLWTTAPDGRITLLNRRWYEYTGADPAGSHAGRTPGAAPAAEPDANSYVHPDDLAGVAAAWAEHLPGGRRPGRDFAFEYRLRGRDGRYRWHLGRVVARRDAEGAIAEWVGTGTDVHDAREAEAHFRAAQELAPTGFLLLAPVRDARGTPTDVAVRFINPAGARLAGRPADELVGRPLAAVFPALSPPGLWDAYRAVLATGVPVEREVAYPEHGAVASAYHVTAVRVGDGLAVSFADVTERAAALAAAEQARAEAEAANTAKAQFLASMSHELRTPLNAIGGYVQLVDMGLYGPVTGEQRAALERVTRAQQHLLGLINDVLNYAKLESGRVEYSLAPTDVAEVVAEVVPLVEPQVAARGLAFAVDLPADGPAVWADREKLRQVLVNLLSNAVKFTEPGGRVAVDAGVRAAGALPGAPPGAAVYVRVRDTGIGIPRDKQDAIFEPFVQVRPGLTRSHEGTGLGLAISRDLARGMGGDLRVRSAPGHGSAFTLTLRRVAAEDGTPVDRRTGDDRRLDDGRRAGDPRRHDPAGAVGWAAVVWDAHAPEGVAPPGAAGAP